MLLTDHERGRFCQYLRQQIESGKIAHEQLQKLPMGDALAARERQRIAAWIIVLADLESVESFTVTGEEMSNAD